MPLVKGTVTKLLRTRAENKVFGVQVNGADYLLSFPDKREKPWTEPTEVGQVIEGTWAPYEKDGKEKRYLVAVEVIGTDVTPGASSEASGGGNGQFRSPIDFRRTSALAQSVAHYAGSEVSPADVIATASKFEKYLEGGYKRESKREETPFE